MNDMLKTMLAWIGVFVIGGVITILAYYALSELKEFIGIKRWEHVYKHRFDKPPTAACYCKDCVYHGTKYPDGANPCSLPGIEKWTPDNGFCYEAEPITLKEADRRRNGND